MNLLPIRPQAEPSPGLTIRLLGDFAVTHGDEPITLAHMPRLQALLTYLLLHRQAPQSRRHMAFLFWPDSAEKQALTNLRKQLLYLRQVLPHCDALLVMDRQSVYWLPGTLITVDVETFQTALAEAATAPDSQAIVALRRAVACYAGELLPGCYDEWIFAEREALHTQYGHALERLIQLLEAQRAHADAIGYSEQLLRHDPLREATYRQLMRLHALNGDRAAALRVYHACLTQLREELGVDPEEETQAAYERLLHQQTQPEATPTLAANAPFVGRETEWQTLQRLWRTVQRGSPHFVLLAGEAGIGKSRLAEELLHWAHHQGIATAHTRAYAAEGRLAYAPVMEWLRSPAVRPHLRKIAPAWLTELARLLPELLTEWPALPPPAPLTQSWQRRHLFEALTRALFATGQPLVLLLDDLQWCDQETLAWLHFLLRFTDSAPPADAPVARLLLIGTARLPDEVPTDHPLQTLLIGLQGSGQLTQLNLARFTAEETALLACRMAALALQTGALRQLYEDTAGNPLFVVETIRATLEQEPVVEPQNHPTAQRLATVGNGHGLVTAIPPKVLTVIQGRLGQLSPAARNLSEWAAVIGREFTLDLLQMASKLPESAAVAALDELWQRRIIREQGADTYDFSHDRIRDVAAAGISRVRWRHFHRCVAEALERQSLGQVDSVAAQIATHYEAAGVIEQAIVYYQQAAEVALRIYANQAAITYLNRALELLHTRPSNRIDAEREYQLLLMVGTPLVAVEGHGSQTLCDHYLNALTLAKQLNSPPDPAILRILAIYYLTHRQFDLAYNFGWELLNIAQSAPQTVDAFLYVEGCYALGVISFWQGRFQQSRQHLERGIRAYDRRHHARHVAHYGQDPGVACLSRLAWALWYLGYPEQALQGIRQALDLATRLKHPFSTEYALTWMQWLSHDLQDQVVAANVDELIITQQAQPTMPTMIQPLRSVIRGKNLVASGQVAEGMELIYTGIEMAAVNRYEFMFKSHFQAILAQALLRVGDSVQAKTAVDVALTHVTRYGDNYYLAELYRLKGEILLAEGKSHEIVEQNFQQALAIAREQQAKSLELRAAMSLARLWDQQGRRAEAHMLLAELYDWFTEGFDTVDLQEAHRMLEQLG
jgi:DNA-binding SARP family transcriptional activator